MAVPKSKISRSRRGMRRSHDSLKKQHHIVKCNETGEPHLHGHCYIVDDQIYYNGKLIESGEIVIEADEA